MNQTGRNWHLSLFLSSLLPIPGGEERPENNLQVPRRLRLMRRTDLLEAAVPFPRHRAAAEVPIRHCSASSERHQRSHWGDGARRPASTRPEPAHYWSSLPWGVPQLLQTLSLLPWYRRPVVCQRHQLSESVLRTRLQHGHAPHQPVLPLPGALVLPRGVSDVCERGGGVHVQERITRDEIGAI